MSLTSNNNPQGSYCKEVSPKDRVIFFTKKDLEGPVSSELLQTLENYQEEPGVVLPNGKINWNCPCLGNMASGPCAVQFRAAFSCFHYSTSDVKGIECVGEFDKLQECMKKFPSLFSSDKKSPTNIADKDL